MTDQEMQEITAADRHLNENFLDNRKLETATLVTSDTSAPPWWTGLLLYLAAQIIFMLYSSMRAGATYPTNILLLLYLNPLVWLRSWIFALPLVPLHEISHYLVFRWAGASPTISEWRPDGPDSPLRGWCVDANAPGMWFGRNLYLFAILAPSITVNLLAFALLSLSLPPVARALLIIALSGHLPGCIHDWRTIRQILSVPASALIEDRPEGFAYRVP
jgi:hypothetical protein